MKLRHIYSGNVGTFVEKRNGFYGEVTIIRLADGRQYFAPTHEFEEYISGSDECIAHQLKLHDDFMTITKRGAKIPGEQ